MCPTFAEVPAGRADCPQGRLVWFTALAILPLLAACAGQSGSPSAAEHVVRRGETLYTIAWRYGRDYRDLARWNQLGDGSLIFPGQVIRLDPPGNANPRALPRTAPRKAPAVPPVSTGPSPSFVWPTSGPVAVEFGTRPGSGTGVLIGGRGGQPVRAAADGRVVYAGGGLIGYGKLIIVKHNETYLSAYGHNSTLLVREGESVRQGQRIAAMGEGPGRQPRLHFEIRKNGRPVNPRQYLPAR